MEGRGQDDNYEFLQGLKDEIERWRFVREVVLLIGETFAATGDTLSLNCPLSKQNGCSGRAQALGTQLHV